MLNEGADAIDELSTTRTQRYDVFLSFCGEDSGSTFTGNIYNALRQKRIKTFFQPENDDGEPTSLSVDKAIQESRLIIVVFSENYAASASCLNELVKIVEDMIMNNQLVWPVYYGVEAPEIRHQLGRYGEAMAKFEERYEFERVKKWRNTLFKVSESKGWAYYQDVYEYKFIQEIVESAVQSLSRFDIFLSFSGEDTRYSFTGFLYHALRREGFKTFMDDEGLVGGNEIAKSLLDAIEKSRLSIIVFSENYGYSSWCLDELVKIVECMETKKQLVWPIFYKVEKSDVTSQENSYEHAMIGHEKNYGKDSDEVKKWRSALSAMAKLEGHDVKENKYEYEFIKKIVEKAIAIENHM